MVIMFFRRSCDTINKIDQNIYSNIYFVKNTFKDLNLLGNDDPKEYQISKSHSEVCI